MTIIRAHVLRLAAVTLAALAVPGIGSAQTYPSRPVRIVLSLPPGRTPDVLAPILGNKLTEQTGQPVIVDSRPGASDVMAVEIAKAAPPDGYTLLLAGTTNFATLPALKPKLSYNIDND